MQQYENEGETFLADGGENKAVKRKDVVTDNIGEAIKEKDAKASKEFVGGAYCVFRTAFTKAIQAQGEKHLGPSLR